MKTTIAKKTLLPVLIVVIVFLLIFFATSYKSNMDFVTSSNKDYLESIAFNFHFLMDQEKKNGTIRDRESLREFLSSYGDNICNSYELDYVSAFVPDFENVTLDYISISNHPSLDINPAVSMAKSSGFPIVRQTLSDEFKKVWYGEKKISTISYNNEYGHELCTIIKETTSSGYEFIITFEESYEDIYKGVQKLYLTQSLTVVLTFLLCLLAIYFSLRKNVTEPAKKVSEAMNTFITDGSRSHIRLEEKSNDEFGSISKSFNKMAENIDTYIEEIGSLNEQEERQKAELSISSKIQMGFLPAPNANFGGCDINALMDPARNVGGDLYDYLRLDDDRMLIMIADVSGKGLGAAFFMAATITLLHQFAHMDMEPSEILEATNRCLFEKNPSMLFVTAFAGIYNNKTLEFTYSNAGHNHPYLIADDVMALDGAHGTVLGLYEGETYEQTTVKLNPGDILYLYTDGVTETVNTDRQFFGTGRLEAILKAYHPEYKKDLVTYITAAIRDFSAGAEQSDDITMLALTAKAKTDLYLDVDCKEFSKVKSTILESNIPQNIKLSLCLAAEEIFINICSYAFEGRSTEGEKIHVSLSFSDHTELRFEDGGAKYDPRQEVPDTEEYDIDSQIGGLGKFIAFNIADDVSYEYTEKKNILTLIKY